MVDPKYRKIYDQPIKYRLMTPDKWLYAEKYATIPEAVEASEIIGDDCFAVETFPGYKKFPVYSGNVK